MTMQVNGYKRWRLTQQVIMPPQPVDPWMWGPHPYRYGYPGWGWYNPARRRYERSLLSNLLLLLERDSGSAALSFTAKTKKE